MLKLICNSEFGTSHVLKLLGIITMSFNISEDKSPITSSTSESTGFIMSSTSESSSFIMRPISESTSLIMSSTVEGDF